MDWFFWTSVVIAGALAGSFLNVVIYRGPSMWGLLEQEDKSRGNLLRPRSYCPSCGAPIASWRLVPIVSFLLQGGKCAACRARISLRYPLVEFSAIAIAVISYALFGATIAAGLAAIFGWSLLALAAIDFETGYLPDWLTLPLIAVGLLANLNGRFVPLTDAVIGALAGYGAFRLIAFVFRRMRNYDGLGQGDAKLLAAVGAWTGWATLPGTVLAAALSTLAIVGVAALGGAKLSAKSELPFGPGLCAAGFVLFAASAHLS